MRYFVANGYLPSAHAPLQRGDGVSHVTFSRTEQETRRQRGRRYREAGIEIPDLGIKRFLCIPKMGSVSLLVYGVYDALLLINAESQRKVYMLGGAVRAAMTCFYGTPPGEQTSGFLLELAEKPSVDISHVEIVDSIIEASGENSFDAMMLGWELQSGFGLNHVELTGACGIATQALRRPRLLDALMHLEYSRSLFWGFMVGSFYEHHYSRDRRSSTPYQMERSYLENRFRYDAAFVAAFRGLECVLGAPHFKKAGILQLLTEVDREFGTSFARSRHRSWHETFSSRRRWWSHGDLIAYYLKLRNAVAAHGNPSPPHIVMEDQVFEIQCLLQSMLGEILLPPNRGVSESSSTHKHAEAVGEKWTPKRTPNELEKVSLGKED